MYSTETGEAIGRIYAHRYDAPEEEQEPEPEPEPEPAAVQAVDWKTNPLGFALEAKRLVDSGLSLAEAGAQMGQHRRRIEWFLAIANASESVRDALSAKQFAPHTAFLLAQAPAGVQDSIIVEAAGTAHCRRRGGGLVASQTR